LAPVETQAAVQVRTLPEINPLVAVWAAELVRMKIL
jgi:hypothetical protein